MALRFSSFVVAVAVALAGCSSGGTGGGGGQSFPEFCGKVTDTIGAQISTCNSGPKELWVKVFAEEFRCGDLARSVDAGRVAYDPAFAQPCLTAAAGLNCAALFTSATTADCTKALSGKVAIGGTCYLGVDCGEGRFCARASGACSGTCKAEIAAGVACATGDACVRGYACTNSVCTLSPPDGTAEVGASCSGSIQCRSGLACDRLTSNCAGPIKEGQPCVFGHGTCETFTSCSSTTQSCVRFATAGGPCGVKSATDGGTDYEYAGCLDAFCKVPSNALAGTCLALAAEQGVCGSDRECASGTCTASKCAPRCAVP